MRKRDDYFKEERRFGRTQEGRSGERLIGRLLKGCAVRPCGKECRDFGYVIASQDNHCSFMNFKDLMNDEEFLLEIARTSSNPLKCQNYFYQYVNEYLKTKRSFRIKFLKNIYLNDHVYKLEDIQDIVSILGFESENAEILTDESFKLELIEKMIRLEKVSFNDYHCSGDADELRDYKDEKNSQVVLYKNIVLGLKEIISQYENKDENEKDADKSLVCEQAKIFGYKPELAK